MGGAGHARADRVLDALARVAHLVSSTGGSFKRRSCPVVSSETLRAALEAVADLVQIVRAVVHARFAGEHQQLALRVRVPLLSRVVLVPVVVLLRLPRLVLQALQVEVPHVVVAARGPDALSLGPTAVDGGSISI